MSYSEADWIIPGVRSTCCDAPVLLYGTGRLDCYCRECRKQRNKEIRALPTADRTLHRMADQYRPQEAIDTKTADPEARHPRTKEGN